MEIEKRWIATISLFTHFDFDPVMYYIASYYTHSFLLVQL